MPSHALPRVLALGAIAVAVTAPARDLAALACHLTASLIQNRSSHGRARHLVVRRHRADRVTSHNRRKDK